MTNKPYKCMYCGTRYKNLSQVSICPCEHGCRCMYCGTRYKNLSQASICPCEHGSIVHPFSPVSNVPNTGAGETPNDTPAHNPLSNGVPVSRIRDIQKKSNKKE